MYLTASLFVELFMNSLLGKQRLEDTMTFIVFVFLWLKMEYFIRSVELVQSPNLKKAYHSIFLYTSW